jgi:hypothetical protein
VHLPWQILGIPVPWPLAPAQVEKTVAFAATFSKNLAANPVVAQLGVDGKPESALTAVGGEGAIGVSTDNIAVTE